ncbi:MAG: holo-ACP synthase [Mycoplasmatales bacterium]
MIKQIGCDIVEHSRVNLKIASRILTDAELETLNARTHEQKKIEFIASRFAAKEAIIKATNKQFLFKDIEISNGPNGEPLCNIKGILLSISHERNYSIAYAIYLTES